MPDEHLFLASNHISWIDILALGGATGAAFVAHDGVGKWPIIGWLAAQNNTILVARSDRRGVGGQVDALRAAIAGHQPLLLFPEGTTNDGRALLPFKPALFAVLTPPPRDLLIQPVHIDYGPAAPAVAWFGAEPALANVRRVLARKGPLDITIRLLEPFSPSDFADRKAVAAEARRRIEASMAQYAEAPAAASAPPFAIV